MKLKSLVAALAAFAALATSHPALALDKVSFATNWLAEAEHGGFYQAVADGTYAKYGLEVKIVPGGPQANNRLLLISGKVDFFMGANMIQALDAVKEGVPTLAVASMFQKDPIIYMSHPGVGLDKIDDLKKAAKIATAAQTPGSQIAGEVTRAQVREIAQMKIKDLNAVDEAAAMRMVEGTARSCGIKVVD